jgi:hypothetical protein
MSKAPFYNTQRYSSNEKTGGAAPHPTGPPQLEGQLQASLHQAGMTVCTGDPAEG